MAWVAPSWLQVQWPPGTALSSIALKELVPVALVPVALVPVALASAVWGPQWSGQLVQCHSDNTAVVAQVNSLHAHDPHTCNMLCCIALSQAQFDFHLRAAHITGARNVGADHLSRGRSQAFLTQFPSFSSSATQVPPSLVHLLCVELAAWTSLAWKNRFSIIWRLVLLNQPAGCTGQDGQDTWPLHGHLPSSLPQ